MQLILVVDACHCAKGDVKQLGNAGSIYQGAAVCALFNLAERMPNPQEEITAFTGQNICHDEF